MDIKLFGLMALMVGFIMVRMERLLKDLTAAVNVLALEIRSQSGEVKEARSDIREATAKHTLPARSTPPALPKVSP